MQLVPWECSNFEDNFYWFLYQWINTYKKGRKSLEILFYNIEVSLDSTFLFGLIFGAIDVVVDCLHDFVVLAWFLIEFDAEIEEDELKNILFVFTAAIFQLVLKFIKLFLLAALGGKERLTNLSVYQRNFLV